MKNNKNLRSINSILLLILSLTLFGAARAQSNDIDNPTPLTTNIVEGEGDGKAESVYYAFTATKGDVKVTIDAKTDDRSTPLRVALLDEDGNELLPIYVVAKGAGARETKIKRFVRDTKVILKIRMDDDRDVKLLTYKIKLDGAVKIEAAPMPETTPTPEPTPTPGETTGAETSVAEPQTTGSTSSTSSGSTKEKSNLKDKIKKKIKKEAKKVVNDNLDN